MSRPSATIPAARFKAQCLSLLDRVQRTGERVTVTKRGRPVADVVPVAPKRWTPWRGRVRILGDLVAPTGDRWNTAA